VLEGVFMRSVRWCLLGSIVALGCGSEKASSARPEARPAEPVAATLAVPEGPGGELAEAPVASPAQDVVEPAPDGHRVDDLERWREDCDAIVKYLEAAGEPALEEVAKLPCTLTGDLDGDGKQDRVTLVAEKVSGTPGFAVKWGSGEYSVIGGTRRVLMRGAGSPDQPDDEIYDEIHESMDWLVNWKIASMRAGKIRVHVLGRTIDVALPGLQGDALHVSGGDAAALFYFDGTDWRWHHLGY
jgi:hypothetical protein